MSRVGRHIGLSASDIIDQENGWDLGEQCATSTAVVSGPAADAS